MTWDRVTPSHVAKARQIMVRDDWTLADMAQWLNVSRTELDLALWMYIAEPLGRAPRSTAN